MGKGDALVPRVHRKSRPTALLSDGGKRFLMRSVRLDTDRLTRCIFYVLSSNATRNKLNLNLRIPYK